MGSAIEEIPNNAEAPDSSGENPALMAGNTRFI
jgi:hypothetical protein